MTKKEREEAALVKIDGGRKKGGKKPKVRAAEEQEDVFSNIDISLLNLFAFLKVSPALDKDSLEPKIVELNNKLKFYNEEG